MNVLPIQKKLAVISALVEGNSIRSIERMFGVHRDTIMRLLVATGQHCQAILNERMRGLMVNRLELDEIWTYCRKKQKRVRPEENGDFGSQFVFVALDPYARAIDDALGADVDYAMLIKSFGAAESESGTYHPSRIVGIFHQVMFGTPDRQSICTSFVERQNLTMRMQMRRFTRLTNAFSKKLENLKAALALHFAWYNFARVHRSLRVTPAMQAGLVTHVWELASLIPN